MEVSRATTGSRRSSAAATSGAIRIGSRWLTRAPRSSLEALGDPPISQTLPSPADDSADRPPQPISWNDTLPSGIREREMNSFTSNKFDMKRFTETAAGLAVDADGRLYSPEVRRLTDEHLPSTARPIAEALSALGVAARMLHLSMERWAEKHGLSEGRLAVLFRLRHQPEGVPLGELAASLHVSPRNVTGLIDHLERDGLVVRVADPSDRRSVLARLTDRGRARLDGLWQGAIEVQSRCVQDLSSEELAQLRHLCLRLVQNLKSQ